MTQQHPITPPPELVQQWLEELYGGPVSVISPFDQRVLIAAAQWGADRQLEADAQWLDQNSSDAPHLTITPTGKGLVETMRSKPPSLKEQALALVEQHEDGWRPSPKDWDTIRRALEALPDSIVVFPSQC
jgi:hypothetical protein